MQLPDEITITWSYEDVLSEDPTLTAVEARQVLQLIADLDNSFIDKETIAAWIKYFKSI